MLDGLMRFRTGEGVHPFWHLEVEIDLGRNINDRVEQRAYLARYARQEFFDKTRSIPEIEEAMRAINKIVSEENATSSARENR
jgi:hypothetical protein